MSNDPFLTSLKLSQSAINAQGERFKVASENIANEFSTGIDSKSDPYRRKTISFQAVLDNNLGSEVVKTTRGLDDSDFKMVYDPSHPAADAEGYKKLPNIDINIEKRDAMEASRSIEANIATIESVKSMISKTLSIIN